MLAGGRRSSAEGRGRTGGVHRSGGRELTGAAAYPEVPRNRKAGAAVWGGRRRARGASPSWARWRGRGAGCRPSCSDEIAKAQSQHEAQESPRRRGRKPGSRDASVAARCRSVTRWRRPCPAYRCRSTIASRRPCGRALETATVGLVAPARLFAVGRGGCTRDRSCCSTDPAPGAPRGARPRSQPRARRAARGSRSPCAPPRRQPRWASPGGPGFSSAIAISRAVAKRRLGSRSRPCMTMLSSPGEIGGDVLSRRSEDRAEQEAVDDVAFVVPWKGASPWRASLRTTEGREGCRSDRGRLSVPGCRGACRRLAFELASRAWSALGSVPGDAEVDTRAMTDLCRPGCCEERRHGGRARAVRPCRPWPRAPHAALRARRRGWSPTSAGVARSPNRRRLHAATARASRLHVVEHDERAPPAEDSTSSV